MTRDLVLVDASIWIDYINKGDPSLSGLLEENRVLTHLFVIGEVALGSLKNRDAQLRRLAEIPTVTTASHETVIALIGSARLWGSGIGYIDAHLLAAAQLTGIGLWTRDRLRRAGAERLAVAVDFN